MFNTFPAFLSGSELVSMRIQILGFDDQKLKKKKTAIYLSQTSKKDVQATGGLQPSK
jgi:hypothetical protein